MINQFFTLAFAALALGSLPLWHRANGRCRQGGSLLNPRKRLPSPLGLVDVAIMFMIWFAGQALAVGLAMVWLNLNVELLTENNATQLALMAAMVAVGQLLATGLALAVIWLRYRDSRIFGWQPDQMPRDLGIGLIAFVMVVPGILILQRLLTLLIKYSHPTMEAMANDHSWLTFACSWFAAVLVAPVCEELFFRGVLQSWLQRLAGPQPANLDQTIVGGWDAQAAMKEEHSWMPIVVSAGIFAAIHIGQGPAPISLFAFGLTLGYLFRQTGSILPCIILHAGLNGFTMFWFTLQTLLT